MKIDRVDIFAVRIPYVRPIKFSYGSRTVGDYLVLKIYTDDGAYGIGAGGALWPPVSGENIRGAIQLMEEYFIPSVLLGENPFNINKIVDAMDRLCVGQTMTKSSVDFTLHDLMGRVYGVPIYQLLGGAQRETIPQEWIVLLDTPEKMAEVAKEFVDRGYAGVKMKWSGDYQLDLERTRQIRAAIGDKAELCVDVNQGYSAEGAIRIINATEDYNMKFVEEPVHRDDFEGFVKVRQHTRQALAADESAWTLSHAVRFLKAGLVDYLHAAPSRIGGLVKLRRYVEMAQANFVEHVVKEWGAENAYFMMSADPHPVSKFLDLAYDQYEAGDLVLFNAEVSGPGGYFTQLERTLSLGTPTKEAKEAYSVCLEALDRGASLLRPGQKAKDVYRAISGAIQERGHRMGLHPGHSQGLDIFERPLIDEKEEVELSAGMIIVLHPHVLLPSGGGVWIGETFVVTDGGPDALQKSPMDLKIIEI